MRARHGAHVFLSYPDARMLAAQGTVRLIDTDFTNNKAHMDTNYLYRTNWNRRRLQRIAWVQNYSKSGGAEISNFNCVAVGNKLGFDIIGYNLDGNPDYSLLESSDLVIVNNMHTSPDTKATFLDWLYKSNKPFVKYDHDCFEEEKGIYQRSKLNVFISPKHQQYYESLCGTIGNSICLPLAFDVDRWQSIGKHEKDSVLIVAYEKCRNNVQDFIANNPQYRYYVTGNTVPIGRDVSSLGEIEYTKIQKLYPDYETVLHLPQERCAGERVLFESILSGCKVITNDNAYHTSWKFDWQDEKVLCPILKRAVYEFWAAIDGVLHAN
jgi:hypothetical protein